MTKKFQHDCESCIYQGQWTGPSPRWQDERVETFDLYVCERSASMNGSTSVSMLARYGNSESEYLSGEAYWSVRNPDGPEIYGSEPLREAFKRYIESDPS